MEKIEKLNRIDKVLENVAQKAAEITISKDSSLRELWDKGDLESKKEFREKTKELWREFAVHGVTRFDGRERKVKFLPYTDLDGKTSLGLLKKAGFDISNVEYVPPGEFVSGAINIDTGGKTGIVVSEEDRTAWLDHHGEEAGRATMPAERITYLTLVSLGFLQKDKTLDKLTQFVSRVDRRAYPNYEKLFWKSDRTVLGLQRFFDFDRLYDYFEQGRSPEEELSDEDLKKYGLEQKSKEQKKVIEETKRVITELENEGAIIDTKFGKVVIDIGKRLISGYDGVRASGFSGYLIFNPKTDSFFMSIHNADLTDLNLSQGVAIRKNMWIKPSDGKTLEISLKEIIEKLGGKISKDSKLEKSVNALELRFKKFTVMPVESYDKKRNLNYITKELGKLAIFPREFKPEKGKKYTVRIKSDSAPGEDRGVYYLEVVE